MRVFFLLWLGGHVLFELITIIARAVIFPSPGANYLPARIGLMSAITKALALLSSF